MPDYRKPIPKSQKELSNNQVEPYVNPETGETRDNPNLPQDKREIAPKSQTGRDFSRSEQTSFKGDDTKPFTVSIQDVDEAILFYFENVIRPTVIQNGERIAVPLVYGSPERFSSMQKDGFYRDKKGKIMSPIIMFKRDSLEKNYNITNKLDANVETFKQLIKTPRKSVIARSEKQSDYIKALKENDIVMSLGPAGTGKSFLAVSVAITLLMEKKIERVILSRPAVEAGEKLGFLPGDMKEKVDPYLRPLYDALYELFGADKIDKKIETGEIEIAPLAFMRGRTLKNCFAILDEAQNATETQIKMFLTRIGENSKLVVNGDPSQVDLINKEHSGLIKSKKVLEKLEEIKVIVFDHNDVVRHPLVSKIIRAYQNKNADDKN